MAGEKQIFSLYYILYWMSYKYKSVSVNLFIIMICISCIVKRILFMIPLTLFQLGLFPTRSVGVGPYGPTHVFLSSPPLKVIFLLVHRGPRVYLGKVKNVQGVE